MELIDLVDENNNLIGKVLDRKEIHEKGLWHREIAVIIVNEQKQLLLQKRASTKLLAPNVWALTMGHIDSGESEIEGAIREVQEELGINNLNVEDFKLSSIEKSSQKTGKVINNIFRYVYIYKTNKKVGEFIIQESELSEVKYFSIDELIEIHNNKEKYENDFINSIFSDYFYKVIEMIKNC